MSHVQPEKGLSTGFTFPVWAPKHCCRRQHTTKYRQNLFKGGSTWRAPVCSKRLGFYCFDRANWPKQIDWESINMAANGDFTNLSKEATYKILVLGDSNVGKTCLIYRYCDREFYESYISTIGIVTVPFHAKVNRETQSISVRYTRVVYYVRSILRG